ncbi:hypothetical protein C8J57DRAFT_1263008 [Mycena rebaudengoi]|nr:hypothetical protein C8J57DRAFT_1263008 [Mycena rebaudengoi]
MSHRACAVPCNKNDIGRYTRPRRIAIHRLVNREVTSDQPAPAGAAKRQGGYRQPASAHPIPGKTRKRRGVSRDLSGVCGTRGVHHSRTSGSIRSTPPPCPMSYPTRRIHEYVAHAGRAKRAPKKRTGTVQEEWWRRFRIWGEGSNWGLEVGPGGLDDSHSESYEMVSVLEKKGILLPYDPRQRGPAAHSAHSHWQSASSTIELRCAGNAHIEGKNTALHSPGKERHEDRGDIKPTRSLHIASMHRHRMRVKSLVRVHRERRRVAWSKVSGNGKKANKDSGSLRLTNDMGVKEKKMVWRCTEQTGPLIFKSWTLHSTVLQPRGRTPWTPLKNAGRVVGRVYGQITHLNVALRPILCHTLLKTPPSTLGRR